MTNRTDAALDDNWAEVRARDQVIRYHRSGAGRPVIILPTSDGQPMWAGLALRLGRQFRVFVPESLRVLDDPAAALTALLDGLGVPHVALVAPEPFCMPALELALLDADRITRIVLVPDGMSGESGVDGRVESTGSTASVPLLVVRRALPAAEGVQMVADFLAMGESHGG